MGLKARPSSSRASAGRVYLELRDSKSSKFWEATVAGAQLTVRYGRIGTQGQAKTTPYETALEARATADRAAASKLRKGYRPASAPHNAPPGKNRANSAPAAKSKSASQGSFAELLEGKRVAQSLASKGRKATASQLAKAGKALSVSLPASYSSFCRELGPGVFGDLIAITAPISGRRLALMEQVELGKKTLAFCADEIPPRFHVANMVSFASTMDGINFYWKIDEASRGEFPIYAIDSQGSPVRVIPVANSFTDFVKRVCLGNGLVQTGVYGSLRGPLDPVFHQIK